MEIRPIQKSPNFMRKLKPSEEAEYSDVLKLGKQLVSQEKEGKSILIIPSPSLPQSVSNSTGIGNLSGEETREFVNFAKKYWGINELQMLPTGQFFTKDGHVPVYTGSSMDFGNHIINLKKYLPDDEYIAVVQANSATNVNYENIILRESVAERALRKLHRNMPYSLKAEFESYKNHAPEIIDRKSLYRALEEINGTYRYQLWNEVDSNLFNPDIVSQEIRDKRIAEIKLEKAETIDFYKFKQFLAEESLKDAKAELNSMGIKLNGDMICGFAYDERWSHPKAFLKDYRINWGSPALDVNSPEAELVLREKTAFYAKHFDGFRVDAAWTYAEPNLIAKADGKKTKACYGDKFLNIIDDEVSKVKGKDYDLNNVMYEFSANSSDFNIHTSGDNLKPYVKDRVKIYTSDYMHETWGHTANFADRGWANDKYILGITNHDSPNIKPNEEQINILSKLYRIPKDTLKDAKEFFKTKIAEPMRAKNTMLFFMTALGIDGKYKDNHNKPLDFRAKISHDYQDRYFKSLENGEGFNPMDALERNFKAMGLDKTNKDLYQKIVKYRDILSGKRDISASKIGIITAAVGIAVLGAAALINNNQPETKN